MPTKPESARAHLLFGEWLRRHQHPSDARDGVVQVHRWRPGTETLDGGRNLAIYAGVGRKP